MYLIELLATRKQEHGIATEGKDSVMRGRKCVFLAMNAAASGDTLVFPMSSGVSI